MVAYIKSDLEFILAQIKIAEDHALYVESGGTLGKPLFGPGGSIPTYNLSWGLRTVDGTYNNPLNPTWGSSDQPFPEGLGTDFRDVTPLVLGPPGTPPTASNYDPMYKPGASLQDPTALVVDPQPRIISNLIVDQTLANPAAILTALQRAGADPADQMGIVEQISAAYLPIKPLFEDLGDAQRTFANASAALAASPDNPVLQQAAANAQAAVDAAQVALDAASGPLMELLDQHGIVLEGANIQITNTAPDEGLSAPFNSWFTLFGQFFDHGLDLVNKGSSGTVYIPLQPDDPLYVPGSQTNFMVLTRATVGPGADGVMGDNPATVGIDESADDTRPVNTTTPFVDQNQTYTSHPSHQVFLREYVLNSQGRPVATGELIQGANGGMATWADVKQQAREILGIDLTDYHVGNLPLMATDPYGNFIPDPLTGFPQVVMAGPPQHLASGIGTLAPGGSPSTLLSLVQITPDGGDADTLPDAVTHLAVRTGHAFLADIAHSAVPEGKIDDGDTEIGLANPGNGASEYDNELLDAHFVAGDGRANENVGLTAVHHVFHAEHNRLVQHTKDVVLATNDLAFINQWLAEDLTILPTPGQQLVWDGERLFQAAKFGTEMQYQHLVFEEFARKIQPNINVFLVPDGYDVTINPTIVAEFAHVVYRFGHSMLTESIDRFDTSFTADNIGLIEGFLNPIQFLNNGGNEVVDAEVAAGAIIRGMTRQVGNQIDEFVTSALRNNLLGLPLDLATINLARGRDTGVPSLNAVRREFYEVTNNETLLKPYESWVDFAGHLKNEASIINFIAAYGTHALITGETTIDGKRDAALTLITGTPVGKFADNPNFVMPTDAVDFLNGLGAYGAAGALGGLENVDLWIGGLAEAIMPFGGMLGSTFNFVFETQMEKLQNGDRFYYLQRLDGLHLFSEMEANSFAAMIMRNTDATHLPSDVFSTPGLILEIDRTKQYNPGLGEEAGADGIELDDPNTPTNEAADNLGIDPTGGGILTPLVIRNNPSTPGTDTNYLRYTGGDHVVLGGTDPGNAFNPSGNDILIASIGDDTLFGDGGNDNLEGGFGNDIINGGAGDDIIRDAGGDDNIKGGDGNDAVNAGNGLDLVLGGAGQDFIVLGSDMGSEVFGGEGNDFILGKKNAERILGNEGDDWLETGTFDGAPGDNFDEIFARDGINGHDVFLGDGGFDEFIAEGGDDIMVGSPGRGKMAGMSGWDWATYKDNASGVDADFTRGIVFDENPTPPPNGTLDAYESVEGLSGSKWNDLLTGSDVIAEERLPAAQGGTEGFAGSALTKEGIQRIAGLREVLGLSAAQLAALPANATAYIAGEIILGGDGNDTIMGRGGDDIIDGDKWLDVQIGVWSTTDRTGEPTRLVKSMNDLTSEIFAGMINPGQLAIVRTIRSDDTNLAANDPLRNIDTAKYQGFRSEYAFSATADGQVIVSHAIENQLDGTDKLRNIERVQFLDGAALNIITGTPNDDTLTGTPDDDLILGLAGADTLNGGAGNDILVGGPGSQTATYRDNFSNQQYSNNNGTANFAGNWTESGDLTGGNVVTGGQIRINNNTLQFRDDDNDAGLGTAQIQRTINLAGATAATLSFNFTQVGFDAGERVDFYFSANGVDFSTPIHTITQGTANASDPNTPVSIALTGPFTANAVVRIVVSGTNGNNAGGDVVSIDNLMVTAINPNLNGGVDTLNGGLGNDTYSFTVGDGNDVINEPVNGTSGGAADRISILAPNAIDPLTGLPVIDPVTGLPVPTLTSLNANDGNTGTQNGDLVINYSLPTSATTSVAQTITVAGHFNGTNVETGVERINFNGATYAGYLLGSDDYLISRLDPANRDTGGVNLSASLVNNFIVGEQGVNDVITGGAANDLIFGGTGDNTLNGGLGDDLLVGGSGNGDNDILDGGADLDTMIGLGGNDTYIVDDVGDVVVEAAGAGTDEVQTLMAALSIEFMANVENLSYEGVDADQFVGTGNLLDNIISGGDLADTLSGLSGNDTLQGGLGADTMIGGDGNDVFEVDEAGDVVTEGDGATSGTDRVESDIDYTLGANLENLDLNGTAITGTGNALGNVINGNGQNNQIFGGAGVDILSGGDGNDLLDGGTGDDTINGNDDNDTIVGGEGNDTIDVGGGFNTIVYNAANFGNDTISSFDAAGGAPTNQDRIDLSALGVTATNFGTRVTIQDIVDAGTDDTLITVRDAANAVIGTIFIDEVDGNDITASDFTLAADAPAAFGTPTNGANTITGNGVANLINGLGGNDTLSGGGGNDVINGGEGADALNGDDGNDTLSGGIGIAAVNFADNFDTANLGNSTGTSAWGPDWVESGDSGGVTTGQIRIDAGNNNVLQFIGGTPAGDFNGAQIQRNVDLAGATGATLNYSFTPTALDAGTDNDSVTVFFSRDGTTFVQVDVINSATAATSRSIDLTAFGTGPFTANAVVRFVASSLETGDSVNIDNLSINATGSLGIDTVNGGAGDDTVIWNATGPTDGRDVVDGGAEGAAGDTFAVNGIAGAETYNIYTRSAWQALGNSLAGFNAGTEIIIARNGLTNAHVVAELREIEEIRINSVDPSGATGNAAGDTFNIVGDFSATSLRLNTITIDGDEGDDRIDISALTSAHRIVFKSNGGNDTIIGALQAEDVIELPEGADLSTYDLVENADGTKTISNGTHSVTFTGVVPPQFQSGEPDEDEGDDEGEGEDDGDSDDDEAPDAPAAGALRTGTSGSDTLVGTTGDDNIVAFGGDDVAIGDAGADAMSLGDGADFASGGDGRDVIFGGAGDDQLMAGAGADIVYGDAGADRIFGDEGDDLITAGEGDDTVFGGAGNDLFVAENGDGNDVYFGQDNAGGPGIDTLDMSAVSANVTVNLGSGPLSHGTASSSQTGNDTIWGIENVNTGSGDDTITASSAVNVMNAGAGNDTYKFTSASAADGDTILTFEAGDRVDLTAIDANLGSAGDQSFSLVSGAFSAAGQLAVTLETRADGDFTVVQGNIDGDAGADFKIEIAGHHNLTNANLGL